MDQNNSVPAPATPERKKPGPKRPGKRRSKASVKQTAEMLHAAFEGLGGLDGLIKFGRKHPTVFYRLWARTMPRQVQTEVIVHSEILNLINAGRQRVIEMNKATASQDVPQLEKPPSLTQLKT